MIHDPGLIFQGLESQGTMLYPQKIDNPNWEIGFFHVLLPLHMFLEVETFVEALFVCGHLGPVFQASTWPLVGNQVAMH